jgi:hypothetical protein
MTVAILKRCWNRKVKPNRVMRGAITDLNGNLLTSSNRAMFGNYYVMWLTGIAESATVKNTMLMLVDIPTYSAGGVLLPGPAYAYVFPSYVGVSPQYPGLYQINFQLAAPPNVDGPQNAFPCGPANWELQIFVAQGSGFLNQMNIPISVRPGDLPCGG